MAAEFTASAPGKLVIAGEYAVLDGAPAISAAVSKRASARVRQATGGELHIANTGATFRYTLSPAGMPVWSEAPGEFGAVFKAILDACVQRKCLLAEGQPWQLQLNSADFYVAVSGETPRKLGIGSSAAITVALTAALQGCAGQTPEFALCVAAHRELQQGAGSGIDVATSWHGGVVLMQPVAGSEPLIERMSWPQGLYVRPVWTGIPAATTVMLERLAMFRHRALRDYERLLQQFRKSLQYICGQWQAGDPAALADGLAYYGELLMELDAAAAIGIWSEPHRALRALAHSMQLGYKPSGAGGGDFGLVFSTDEARLEVFMLEVHTHFVPQTHGVEWSPHGLLINGRPLDAADPNG